jgi:plasmid stabilization system protein ParE
MALEIVWTNGAERDLLDLHLQLLTALDQDMELVARVLQEPLESNLRLVRDHPEIAPKVRGTQRLRRRLLGPQNRYGLFYVIEKRGILIHALLDLRQDPQTIWKRLREI